MSIFDYPRINFSGILTLNPGTANNDDYSGDWRDPRTGKNLALIDSATVQPITSGLENTEFVEWIQQEHAFQPTRGDGPEQSIIPAEWNYYGNMSSSATVQIMGVQTGAGALATTDPEYSQLVGQKIHLSGNITDINSEGSPPGTQFFLNRISLKSGEIEISGNPGKAACQWINFARNLNMQGDAGAGGYMYHAITGGTIRLPGFEDPNLIGMVLRYYVYAKHNSLNDPREILKRYATKSTNPADFIMTGTLAPLFADETIRTGPVGRLLANDTPNIPIPNGLKNNTGGKLALAPAVLCEAEGRISVDFLGSFPEQMTGTFPSLPEIDNPEWHDPVRKNPKFGFGDVTLSLRNSTESVEIGPVPYQDTEKGNARGWVFDFDISGNLAAQKLLADPNATFSLTSADHGTVLGEVDYYFVTNQQAIYAEQGDQSGLFVNQGMPREDARFEVYHRGKRLSAADSPPITIWGYRTTPLGFSGRRTVLFEGVKPGTALSLTPHGAEDFFKPGTYLLTFGTPQATGPTASPPPDDYAGYIAPPFTTLTNRTGISVRVLPNEDFGACLTEGRTGTITKPDVTFQYVYEKTLRTYDLLFPAMHAIFSLGDEKTVADNADSILKRTDPSVWGSTGFMPITRDMSESRRQLLQAWCRGVIEARDAGS
ncbi:hypothetical protein [Paracoccus salsus]|uniref:hypothetical protein n=1 Tax=Paracoccus salsus TaxID=2911061 RepID=UPI001F44B1A0|nr:hypothetical protein [Paracoccus salsus]MCF3973987.1 hypothetical protein [Paracoccus salsus]